MINKLHTYLLFGDLFCGVEHYSDDKKDIINMTLLKKIKSEVRIHSNVSVDTINNLKEHLGQGQHISLVINTSQVLTKRIESVETDAAKLLYLAFPNIKVDDIYYEILRQEGTVFISICRKDYISNLLSEYEESGLKVINISLGSLIVSNIINYIAETTVRTSNTIITSNNGLIRDMKPTDDNVHKSYDLNGLKCSSKQLGSLSGAFRVILSNYTPVSNLSPFEDYLLTEFRQTRFFKTFSRACNHFYFGSVTG